MTDFAKLLAGVPADQEVLAHGALVLGGMQFTLFGIHYDRGLNILATVVWGGVVALCVRLDQEAAAGMKRGKKNPTSSGGRPGASLERDLNQALAATILASDPVAVESAEERRARLEPKNRSGKRATRRRK